VDIAGIRQGEKPSAHHAYSLFTHTDYRSFLWILGR
jgi:hypothetical protein